MRNQYCWGNLVLQGNNRVKVFVSYTLKGNELSVGKLIKIRDYFFSQGIAPYIDYFVEKTTQENVESELKQSDLLILVKTNSVYQSNWVRKELELAKTNHIPIYEKTYEEIMRLRFTNQISS